jgi:hypothetical protein
MGWDDSACRVVDHEGAAVLLPRGPLTVSTSTLLRRMLDKHLMDHGRVVVDLSVLRVQWPSAVAVFPTALAACGGWPSARLVLFGADQPTRAALGAARVPAYVPVATDLSAALAALDVRPPRVRRTTELVPTVRIGQHVRALIDTACDEWQIPQCRETARSVATELASNAFEHAAGTFALTLVIDERGFRISVQDDSGSAPMRTADGYGLRVIDELSTSWGVVHHHPGKSVWARVDLFADAR